MLQAQTDFAEQDITRRLADFAIHGPEAGFPKSALPIMRLSLMDWTAVAVAGGTEPVSRIVRSMVSEEGGTAQAGVIGLDVKLPARAAALANGTIAHALDYDDTHFLYLGHPTVAVVPAALAIAERQCASQTKFQEAALIGVETACRVGAWLGRDHYQRGFHQTATSGSFGAAMAAARLLNLTTEQTRHVLGLVSTRASGLKSQFGTMGKPFHAGMAAANGVEAALLVANGFVSAPDGLADPQGFAATHHGGFHNEALDGLGENFVFETVEHKFHACCHGTHAAIEALMILRDRHALTSEDIEAIDIRVHPRYLKVCNIANPRTGLEAKFSYRLTAAMTLLGHDTASLATFTEEICHDPETISLRDRVRVETDDAIAETAAEVRVVRKHGTGVTAEYDLNNGLSSREREIKIKMKAASLLGKEHAETLWQLIRFDGGRPGNWTDGYLSCPEPTADRI